MNELLPPLGRLMPAPGLRVLVTGGTSGIGLRTVQTLEAAGARVFVCGTNQATLQAHLDAAPGRIGVRCDVSRPEEVDALFAALEHELGGLDALINNAGVAGPTAQVEDITPAEWDKTIGVDLTGPFLCSRRAASLLKQSRGSIIHVSSVAGRLGYALRSPYNAAKFGLAGLTESFARELGPYGVRVNAVLPGFVDSDRLNRTTAARAKSLSFSFEEVEAGLIAKTSLRSKVSEEDVSLLIAYLLSDAAAKISGQAISICGNVEYL